MKSGQKINALERNLMIVAHGGYCLLHGGEMTSFLLIRHGAHSLGGDKLAGRMTGVHLSAKGIEQSKRVAERIRHLPIRAIYSSPMERTQETAQQLSEILGIPIQTSGALNEIDLGEWTGKALEELRKMELFKAWNDFRSGISPPGGESALDVQQRIITEMLRLRDVHPGDYVVLVTHGDVIKRAVAYWMGINNDLAKRIEISLASVTAIVLGDFGPWIHCVNSRDEIIVFE